MNQAGLVPGFWGGTWGQGYESGWPRAWVLGRSLGLRLWIRLGGVLWNRECPSIAECKQCPRFTPSHRKSYFKTRWCFQTFVRTVYYKSLANNFLHWMYNKSLTSCTQITGSRHPVLKLKASHFQTGVLCRYGGDWWWFCKPGCWVFSCVTHCSIGTVATAVALF